MKTTLTIILFILLNGCLGQYPDVRYYGQKDSPLTRYKGNDFSIRDTLAKYAHEDKMFENYNEGFVYVGIGQNPDTVYFYWKKYLFYSHQKDIESDKIRKQRNPSYKEYDRLMDSVVKYKKLIDRNDKQNKKAGN